MGMIMKSYLKLLAWLSATVFLIAGTAIVCTMPAAAGPKKAPADISRFLEELIAGWQSGSDTSYLASPYILDVVKVQTKGKGLYDELAVPGPVTGVKVLSQQALPKGTLYAMSATHQSSGSA